tara:strand:- start:54 stop:302 length:249 start_codon:yes stop_codon:yes gene_type:complete
MYRASFSVPKAAFGCGEQSSTAVYSDTAYLQVGVGSYMYTNNGCTSTLGSGWWALSAFNNSFNIGKVVYVGAGGLVTNVYNC